MRRGFWILVGLSLCLPQAAISLETGPFDNDTLTPKIIILPFKIHSQKDLNYLEQEIPAMIATQLGKEGVEIVPYEKPSPIKVGMDWEELRIIGKQTEADYVLWGSLTHIGEKISLDAKMIQSSGQASPEVFYAEGEGLEELLAVVGDLSLALSMKLFKREKIDQIRVAGNRRIESDAILRVIKTKPGGLYFPQDLTEDLRRVYKMGYFEDVRIESEKGAKGKIVIFKVKEKPTLRRIHIKGNRIFENEEIVENLTLKTGSILNDAKINSNVKRIEDLYKDKNYYNVQVVYHIVPLKNNQSDLEFVITEGEKIRISEIVFDGNSAYSDKDLKKIMKTSEKSIFSWLTAAGELKMEDLNQDVARIGAFYQNNGFVQAKVAEPQVTFEKDGIFITIKIDEGPQFKIGQVDIVGDLILPKEELLAKTKIVTEEMYNREVIRNDLLLLTDLYSDEGYAKAEIYPRIDKNVDKLEVDVTYVISKGNPVYFEKILISGNTKTRDKVIRRQLKVYEQELYSGRLLKRSTQNLLRLDYFEDVKVTPLPGSAEDKMVLKIDVAEKPTGTFSFGGGYSSVENFFVMGKITQRNLFGKGQILSLDAYLGGETQRYALSFTEPWLFDIPLSAGFDLYNWDKEYNDYDKDSYGGSIRFGYPVYDYTRAYASYSYENADITNIDEDAAKSIKELEGTNVKSSIDLSLKYDSRDRRFNPSRGSQHSASVEYAGGPLGGDIAFTKYVGETGWYFPLFWGTVFYAHGKVGYVDENSDGLLPDYEKFYLGGLYSLRGYDWQDVSAKDDEGDDIGGNKMVQFNFEFIFPLLKKAGLMGLVFYDTGDVYAIDEDIDFGSLRQTAGYGFRWNSPVGAIRLEYGEILDDEDEGGRWEFSMGSAF